MKKVEEKKAEPKPAAKKDVNPLDVLPPSKFVLDDFKNFFVNCPDRRGEGMKHFLENYDREGYSIFFLHYDKYEGEGTIEY